MSEQLRDRAGNEARQAGKPTSEGLMADDSEVRYEEVIREHVEETWNEGSFENLYDHYLIDASIIHFGAVQQGPEYVRELIQEHRDGFPDLHLEIQDISMTNKTATLYWTFTGTHSGSYHGMRPTETEVEFSGKSTIEFIGSEISKIHGLPNQVHVLRAIGVPI